MLSVTTNDYFIVLSALKGKNKKMKEILQALLEGEKETFNLYTLFINECLSVEEIKERQRAKKIEDDLMKEMYLERGYYDFI